MGRDRESQKRAQQQQVAYTVEQLVAVNPYNPDILPDLKNYVNEQVSSQTYSLDANLCLLRLYQDFNVFLLSLEQLHGVCNENPLAPLIRSLGLTLYQTSGDNSVLYDHDLESYKLFDMDGRQIPQQLVIEVGDIFKRILKETDTVREEHSNDMSILQAIYHVLHKHPELRQEGLAYEVLQWYICRMEAWFAVDADMISLKTWDQIVKALEFIGKKEGLQLPFETCNVQQYPFTSNQAIPPMDWEEYVSEVAADIMREQSPKKLFQVRGKFYELLINCIPPEIILKRLLYELLKKLDEELKHEVAHWAAYYSSLDSLEKKNLALEHELIKAQKDSNDTIKKLIDTEEKCSQLQQNVQRNTLIFRDMI